MKFYSAINQAIKMAEVDYGDKKYWYQSLEGGVGADVDKDGNAVQGSSDAEKWFNKYLAPYMKIIKTSTLNNGSVYVYFSDGSALAATHTTRDWEFFPGNPDKCIKSIPKQSDRVGICSFAFNFNPNSNATSWKYLYAKGFEPWKYDWDGTLEQAKERCFSNQMLPSAVSGRHYCTILIQLNGWKIPDDYPYKVSY